MLIKNKEVMHLNNQISQLLSNSKEGVNNQFQNNNIKILKIKVFEYSIFYYT